MSLFVGTDLSIWKIKKPPSLDEIEPLNSGLTTERTNPLYHRDILLILLLLLLLYFPSLSLKPDIAFSA